MKYTRITDFLKFRVYRGFEYLLSIDYFKNHDFFELSFPFHRFYVKFCSDSLTLQVFEYVGVPPDLFFVGSLTVHQFFIEDLPFTDVE